MALHRDIFWIGRQWAVTGHGMQLVDQRLKGAFDIEVAGLWDDDLIERMHAKEWLNAADFDKGLAVARTRHPQPQAGSTSIVAPPPPVPIAPPEQQSPDLQMKIDGSARFARPWRVWMKKT
ncbi:hypothetical protein [Bradyrhizobium algeriense]|uniref:hypothetical protein n=1 Tax=Bradyrhizobium algeriense TaxID=634784 RepID=UPI000D39F9F8|nr:hypothetical protein [Bradyrhizobium algeriense]